MNSVPSPMDLVNALNVLTGLGFARDASTQEIYCNGGEEVKNNRALFELTKSKEVNYRSNTTDARHTLKCTPEGEKEIIMLARMLVALAALEPEVTWRFHSSASKIWGSSQKSDSGAFAVMQLLKPLIVKMEGTENSTFKIDAFTAEDLATLEAKAAAKSELATCSGCGGCNRCKPTHAALPVVEAAKNVLLGQLIGALQQNAARST